MSKRKHSILNNTKIVMNLLSFLEIADLVQMRNLNSCSKLISNHFIKLNISRDKSKYMNLVCQSENSTPTTQKQSTLSSSISQLRIKFLQLWNIYSNKNSIEKVNYYDSNLSLLIKILIHLMSNVKKGLELSFIPKDLFSQEITTGHNSNIMLHEDDFGDDDLDDQQQDHENTPIYIQEFLRNETIWKLLAKLSGYNLSNAELSSESDGIFEYYLWPEKMDDPKYSTIDQNLVEDILSKMTKMRNLDPMIRKQISVLMNKSSKAELTFYNNHGNVVNKSDIHLVIRDEHEFEQDNCRHHHPLFSQNRPTNCENSDSFLFKNNQSLPINSQLSSTIILWILNFLKLQKQLPCLKQLPRKGKKATSDCNHHARRYHSLHNHSYYNNTNNHHSPPITVAELPASSRYYSRLNCANQQEKTKARVGTDNGHNFSNSSLGDIPETFGKLYSIIHSQENLLVELKQILNTIKS